MPDLNAEDDGAAMLSQLADQAEQAARREREIRERLHQAHLQLAERDDEIALLSDPVPEGRTWLLSERERLSSELAAAGAALDCSERQLARTGAQLAAMRSTRAWRIAGAWWRLRDRILGR